MNILSLCDLSGNMVQPWAVAGYKCTIVDTEHPTGLSWRDGVWLYGCDVLDWNPDHEHYDMVFAFPPCTNLAVSGARWFKDKGLAGLIDGLQLVEACRVICETSGTSWMLENPVSMLSTYWRKPDYAFNPCDFGGYCDPPSDNYTKKTCLWTGGDFRMPEPKPVTPAVKSYIHTMPPSKDRSRLRSVTPMGFAEAVFEANVAGARS